MAARAKVPIFGMALDVRVAFCCIIFRLMRQDFVFQFFDDEFLILVDLSAFVSFGFWSGNRLFQGP